MLSRIWETREYSAPARSAYAVFGADYANYISFVRQTVPRDGTILLSTDGFRNVDIVGFFLVPRELVNCERGIEDEKCLRENATQDRFILAIGDFPSTASLLDTHTFIEHEGADDRLRGIYAPVNAVGGSGDQEGNPITIIGAISPLLISFLVGFTLLYVLGQSSPPNLVGLAFPLGAGMLSWLLFVFSWMGVGINGVSALAMAGGLILVLWLGRRWITAHPESEQTAPQQASEDHSQSDGARRLWSGLIGVTVFLGLISGAIAIGTSYARWDPIAIWGIKGYGIGIDQTIFAAESWGEHGLEYILNIPLQIAMFWIAGEDPLPSSKLIFPLYFVGLLAVVYSFWRGLGLRATVAGAGVLILASIPIVFEQSTAGFTNLPMTYYLLAGLMVGIAGIYRNSRAKLLIAGILLGLAAWTRVEGSLYVLMALSVILVAARVRAIPFRRLAPFLMSIVVIGGTWLAFYATQGAAGSKSFEAIERLQILVRQGSENLFALRAIIGQAAKSGSSLEPWGFALLLSILLIVVSLWDLPIWRDLRLRLLGLAFVFFAFGPVLLFYVGSFRHTAESFGGWLDRGFSRAALPPAILLIVIAVSVGGLMIAQLEQEGRSRKT